MSIDTSKVVADGLVSYVTEFRKGSEYSLWFEQIPVWMTEVPVAWATPETPSNVEVFLQTNNGDTLKAVCDGSGPQSPGLLGVIGGSEGDCAFAYTTSSTPVVADYRMAYRGLQAINITVSGSGFLLGGTLSLIHI